MIIKKSLFLLFLFLIITNVFAFNYTISFKGSGASTIVSNVIVQNMTKGITVTVPSGNVLNLTDQTTAVVKLTDNKESVSIYPNPIQTTATFIFTANNEGSTHINSYALDGKKVLRLTTQVSQGKNSFQLTLPTWIYMLQVQGNGYLYNAKAISQAATDCKPQIVFIGIDNETKPQKATAVGTTTMVYNTGDQLLYKGTSVSNATVIADKPTASKTVNFGFVVCEDADNTNHPIVTFGTQTWMVDSLKTTKYRNGNVIATTTSTAIPNDATAKYQWAYNKNERNVAMYGRLYTWWAATDTRSIAPTGWHVASDTEWTTLQTYLAANGYNYFGTTGNYIANSSGLFYSTGFYGYWLSATESSGTDVLYRYLYNNNYLLSKYYSPKSYGFSVRCVKD
ncbi:MAG: FISUMP domain-containing protein [Paludibacter sp.]|nr:FISUMP domain-containing protein [Paludibacter sp.]